jgi:hypothetical protein
LSRGVSKTAWIATVISTTPRPAPKWPPVWLTDQMVSDRSSCGQPLKLRIRQTLQVRG